MHRHFAVPGAYAAQHILEFHRSNLVNVARRTVGNDPQTTHGLHRRGHVAARQSDLARDVSRKLLLQDQDGRFQGRVERIDDIHEGEPPETRIGQTIYTGHRVACDPSKLGVHAADRLVRVPVFGPGIVKPQAERIRGIGGHHVGDGRGVEIPELLQHLLFVPLGHVDQPPCHAYDFVIR